MFEYDIAARSHFTTLEDGRSAFNHWVSHMKLQDKIPPFEYEQGMTARGKRIIFKVGSWGGYIDMSGRWVVFISWRAESVNVTKYVRWFWDEKTRTCNGMLEQEFVN
jgi:hypothetical protein